MEKKKGMPLPLLVLVICLVIGLLVAGFGLYKQNDSKRINKERRAAALKTSQKNADAANKRLEEIKKEYDETKTAYDTKASECDAIKTGSDGWYEKSNKCLREKQDLQRKLYELEAEDSSIKSKDYTVYYDLVKPMSYQIFYIIGGSVAGLGALAAFIIYLVKGKKTY